MNTARAAGSLGRRVHQIVGTPLDSSEVRSALESLASCYQQTGSVSSNMESTGPHGLGGLARHRDLRTDMQEQVSQLDSDFIASLRAVDAVFSELEKSVLDIDQQCSELRGQVNLALRCTAGAAEQASLLVDERKDLRTRLTLASEFVARFALTADEAQALGCGATGDSRTIVADDRYFAALDKLANTRLECQKLMAVKSQTAVEDLTRELARQEEVAYQGLLRWVLGEVRELNRDSPEFSSRLKQALQKLQSHQTLFDVALKEIAKIRCESLAKSFITALVRGGPNGTPRPIEVHAADPQRYVGDMLAWVHQAYASENELLDTLFSLTDAAQREQVRESKSKLLGMSLENLARPLEIRIEQTVSEIRSPTFLYRIDSLLSFYAEMFAMACPADSAFMATMYSLCNTTRGRLLDILNALADTAFADLDNVPTTLDVPASLSSLLGVLGEIMYLHEDSISHMLQPAQGESTNELLVKPILGDISKMLERIADEAHESASQNAQLKPYEQTIFECNLLLVTQEATSQFISLQAWQAHCTDAEARLGEVLSAQLLDILTEKSQLPFESAESVDGTDLERSLEGFNASLRTGTEMDVARLVSRLSNQAAARSIAQGVSQSFIDKYREFYTAISQNPCLDNMAALLHTPETLSTLL
ncbi:oligomeric complex COG6 [Linderina pennispora]|uniref:Conserved oligomeric Golgi complex subunit 6 n=1 Tax=Linderina pennispora TaxID=61395 RepID=A0A1Y1VXT9_9FUNG|nr:oligomeric complex COG6 [Linderina pennispora]ORX66067.1 oligomeric complex COG6 [Linderina pennispora]